MLAKYYRLRISWVADQTLTYNNGARIAVRLCPWKFTSEGALSYGTTIVLDDDNWATWGAGNTIATGGEVESDVTDNTSNLYLGVKGYFEMTADANSTDGTAYLYLEESDDNTNWPSDQADFAIADLIPVCTLSLSTDAEDEDRAKNFEF
jgi:hypothetical protein